LCGRYDAADPTSEVGCQCDWPFDADRGCVCRSPLHNVAQGVGKRSVQC
jgi:hypothetical protein